MESEYKRLENNEEKQPAAQPIALPRQTKVRPKYKSKSRFTSILGAITHGLTWLRGKSTDTVLVNPHYKKDPEKPAYHIYCIHGTADRSFSFNTMATRLLQNLPDNPSKNMLPENIETIHLLAFDGRAQGNDISFFSDQVKSKIIKNEHKDVIIMGHSRGGNVGADFTERKAKDAGVNVHGVVTYCSPLDGSPWAVSPFTDCCDSVEDMKKDSDSLKTLRPAIAKTNTASKKYFYLGVEKDSVVPTESTYITTDGNAHSVTLLPEHGHLSILRSQAVCGYTSDMLHEISARPVAPANTAVSISDAYRQVDAEIIAFKNRTHLGSTKSKLQVLTDLRDQLKAMHDGNRGELYPEAMTVSQYIQQFFASVAPGTQLTQREILQRTLNKPISFFQCAPPKSQQLIDKLIGAYTDIPLPAKLDALWNQQGTPDSAPVRLTMS